MLGEKFLKGGIIMTKKILTTFNQHKQEEDEKRTRLQATYTKECEKRLTVAAAENIRMKRALDALGGEAALSSGR